MYSRDYDTYYGVISADRAKRDKAARKKKREQEEAAFRGRDLAYSTEPVINALRPELNKLYRNAAKTQFLFFSLNYQDKNRNDVSISMEIPASGYTSKSMLEWLLDTNIFRVNDQASNFNAVSADYKTIAQAIANGEAEFRTYYKQNGKPLIDRPW